MRRTSFGLPIISVIFTFTSTTAALAQQSALDSAARDSVRRLTTVQVTASATGQGQARTANAIGLQQIRLTPTGTSALKVVERLPGVNFQSSDPFGMYEWSNRVTIRGFQTQQIGQTFDGIPLGDMSYGNFNGLGVARAIDPDNLVAATVQQGTGALGTSSANNLGGVIQYESASPGARPGITLGQMFGSAGARKTSGRFDSGIRSVGGSSAVAGFLSFSRIDNDKWKGGGTQYSPVIGGVLDRHGLVGGAGQVWQDQLNAKLTATVGEHRVTAFYDFADRKEADYVDLSLDRWRASGRDWDQYVSWSAAKAGAESGAQDEAYFQSAQGARRDHLAYLSADFRLAEGARLVITPYVHADTGAGDWHAPAYGDASTHFANSWSPDPIYFRQTQYESDRSGVNGRATWEIAGQRLEGGVWYENNTARIRRVAWRLQNYAASPVVDFSNVIRLFFDRTGEFTSTVAYLQNTSTFDRLTLTYGAKYLHVDADFHSNGKTIPTAATFGDPDRPALSAPTKGGLLPQLGAVFRLNATEQLYGTWSENVNQLPYSPQSGVYNTSAAGFDYFKANTDPERASTYEAGIRTRRARVEGSLGAYYVNYRNRLVGVSVCPLTATCVSSFANVGSVSTRGVEGLVLVTLAPGLTWNTAGSYNVSTFGDDYVAGKDGSGRDIVVGSKGKDMVDAPRLMANTNLMLERDGATVTVGGRHVAKRYFSILNESSVPAYTVLDAGAGYTFERLGAGRDVTLRLNVLNLLDESYIGTIGTGGFSVGAAPGLQTLQAGVPRQFFLTAGTTF
jgi:iron complex outermembrane recepter protein